MSHPCPNLVSTSFLYNPYIPFLISGIFFLLVYIKTDRVMPLISLESCFTHCMLLFLLLIFLNRLLVILIIVAYIIIIIIILLLSCYCVFRFKCKQLRP